MDPQTRFWLVVLGAVFGAWLSGEVLSLALWTLMRDRAMLAARLGWIIALCAAMAAVDGAYGLFARSQVMAIEGVALVIVVLLFVLTYRRRPA